VRNVGNQDALVDQGAHDLFQEEGIALRFGEDRVLQNLGYDWLLLFGP